MEDSATPLERLIEQLDKLTEEQASALRSASLAGMTANEVKEYDARCRRIAKVVKELATLQKSHRVAAAA